MSACLLYKTGYIHDIARQLFEHDNEVWSCTVLLVIHEQEHCNSIRKYNDIIPAIYYLLDKPVLFWIPLVRMLTIFVTSEICPKRKLGYGYFSPDFSCVQSNAITDGYLLSFPNKSYSPFRDEK